MSTPATSLIPSFEAELRAKIQSKSNSYQSDETFLVKTLKFFDIHNQGSLDFNNFNRSVEKIGVIIEKDTLEYLFNTFYDQQGTGRIDYKAWAKGVTTNANVEPDIYS